VKAKPTKTLNPLPFRDLEPHRFEDLIRQLAYDLRKWKILEATGRGGSDDGIDIRAIEIVGSPDEEADEEEADRIPTPPKENLWIFQCKREKSFSPKDVQKAVKDSLSSLASPPYGFVLAVACDVSKKARDAFREEMVSRKIEDFAIWANGELEDMLFQPKNDRLLFAYFGLSLQPRRQSLSTNLRTLISKKRQIQKLFENESIYDKAVLLRDPTDTRYPIESEKDDPPHRWIVCFVANEKYPNGFLVQHSERLAAIDFANNKWDAIQGYNSLENKIKSALLSKQAWNQEHNSRKGDLPFQFWREYIPESQQAFLKGFRFVSFDKILAIDPLGDGFYPIPQILMEFDEKDGPFLGRTDYHLESLERHSPRLFEPYPENRTKIFPKPLPGEFDLPPKEFDQTIEGKAQLTKPTDERIEKIIKNFKTNQEQLKKTQESARINKSEPDTFKEFREWMSKVALPVFSSFVKKLRASNCVARVVVHSSRSMDYIDLKIKLPKRSTHGGNEYLASGYFKVSMSYSGPKIESYPTQETRNNTGREITPKLNELTKEFLEGQVATTIELLATSDNV
jgi:hypothetical protein